MKSTYKLSELLHELDVLYRYYSSDPIKSAAIGYAYSLIDIEKNMEGDKDICVEEGDEG